MILHTHSKKGNGKNKNAENEHEKERKKMLEKLFTQIMKWNKNNV